MTFKDDIEEAAGIEIIIGIVIGEYEPTIYDQGKPEGKPEYKEIMGKLISWETAIPYLDYKYDSGFGLVDCHPIYAWTENKILFIVSYAGATDVKSVPRNPIDCMPEMPGG